MEQRRETRKRNKGSVLLKYISDNYLETIWDEDYVKFPFHTVFDHFRNLSQILWKKYLGMLF